MPFKGNKFFVSYIPFLRRWRIQLIYLLLTQKTTIISTGIEIILNTSKYYFHIRGYIEEMKFRGIWRWFFDWRVTSTYLTPIIHRKR